jgi:hypothetical protein
VYNGMELMQLYFFNSKIKFLSRHKILFAHKIHIYYLNETLHSIIFKEGISKVKNGVPIFKVENVPC